MSAVTGPLGLVIDGVQSVTASGSTTATLTFTVYPAAAVCPGGVCADGLASLKQKTFYATEYVAASSTFTTARSFSFSGFKFQRLVDGGKGAQFTATKTAASFAPELSTSAFIYGYIGVNPVITPKGHYQLLDDVQSASKVYGTVSYASKANLSGCEKCHVAPYSKHGYRQGAVAGLDDFVACKACHTDQRVGSDNAWQILVDDPLAYTQLPVKANGDFDFTPAQLTKYAYVANVMNDTHMSHAMEFAYPQTMANCVTCHEGKLTQVISDANYKLVVCKSCHAVTGPAVPDAKRAPPLGPILAAAAFDHAGIDLYTYADKPVAEGGTGTCVGCHAGKFARIHGGINKAIYASETTRYADAFKVAISAASYDGTTKELTFTVTATESPDVAGLSVDDLVNTLVISGYGYGTKDFIVSGHGSTGGFRNAEWATNQLEGALNACDTNGDHVVDATDGPCPLYPRMSLTASASGSWTLKASLADAFGAAIDAGRISRIEIGVLPTLKDSTSRELAVGGVTRTFDLAGNALVADADSYGKAIVSAAKCNACHDALGTTFHGPNYGSAGVVGCRLCHVVGSGGSHLEMQSRSIDSYVHAIHSMQPFDVAGIDFSDPVAAMHYKHHIESTYPSFSTLNCVSCHNAGTFEVPDQTRSLPSILSASATVANRAIAGVPAYVVGPASRACGSCHRAVLINEDAFSSLASFNAHTAAFGTLVVSGTGVLDAVTQDIMDQLGGPAFTGTPVAGTQIESCSICHATAGSQHQALFNTWVDGL